MTAKSASLPKTSRLFTTTDAILITLHNAIMLHHRSKTGILDRYYLANLFLWQFDQAAIKRELAMVRYADDLIFFAASQTECEQIHDFCEHELEKIELHIDPIDQGKTIASKPDQAVEFLGISIDPSGTGYVPNIPEKKINNCRSELMSLGNIDSLIEQKITISTLMQKLNGKIAGWTEAYRYCENLERFEHVLKSSRRKAIETVFTSGLGMSALTTSQRQFLEIE